MVPFCLSLNVLKWSNLIHIHSNMLKEDNQTLKKKEWKSRMSRCENKQPQEASVLHMQRTKQYPDRWRQLLDEYITMKVIHLVE